MQSGMHVLSILYHTYTIALLNPWISLVRRWWSSLYKRSSDSIATRAGNNIKPWFYNDALFLIQDVIVSVVTAVPGVFLINKQPDVLIVWFGDVISIATRLLDSHSVRIFRKSSALCAFLLTRQAALGFVLSILGETEINQMLMTVNCLELLQHKL